MSNIKNATILISGAANGIGRELAFMCSDLGCEKLILIDIDLDGLEKVKSKLRCLTFLVRIDLSVDIENDPEEEQIMLEEQWPHIQVVYELLL